MSLRQQLVSDIRSGRLTHSPLQETGADRIGALGLADPLGSALWRVLAEHDRWSTRDVVCLLRVRLRRAKVPHKLRTRLCWAAVREHLTGGRCVTCQGRRQIVSGSMVRHSCPACDGTGLSPATNASRARAIGCSGETYKALEQAFEEGLDALRTADSRVSGQLARQLERGRA